MPTGLQLRWFNTDPQTSAGVDISCGQELTFSAAVILSEAFAQSFLCFCAFSGTKKKSFIFFPLHS